MKLSALFLMGAYAHHGNWIDDFSEARQICNDGKRMVTAVEKPFRRLFANGDFLAMEFKDVADIGFEMLSRMQPAVECRNFLGKIETIEDGLWTEFGRKLGRNLVEEVQYLAPRYLRMGLTIFKNNVPEQLYKTLTNMIFAIIDEADSLSRDDWMIIYGTITFDQQEAKVVAEGLKELLPDLKQQNMEKMRAIAVADIFGGSEVCYAKLDEIKRIFELAQPHMKKVIDMVKSFTSDKRYKHLSSLGRTIQNVFNLAYAVTTDYRCERNLENMAEQIWKIWRNDLEELFTFARSRINSLGSVLERAMEIQGGMTDFLAGIKMVHRDFMGIVNDVFRALLGKDQAGKNEVHFLMKQCHMMAKILAGVVMLHGKDVTREAISIILNDDPVALQAVEQIDFEAMGRSMEVVADAALNNFEAEFGESSNSSRISAGFALTFALLTALLT